MFSYPQPHSLTHSLFIFPHRYSVQRATDFRLGKSQWSDSVGSEGVILLGGGNTTEEQKDDGNRSISDESGRSNSYKVVDNGYYITETHATTSTSAESPIDTTNEVSMSNKDRATGTGTGAGTGTGSRLSKRGRDSLASALTAFITQQCDVTRHDDGTTTVCRKLSNNANRGGDKGDKGDNDDDHDDLLSHWKWYATTSVSAAISAGRRSARSHSVGSSDRGSDTMSEIAASDDDGDLFSSDGSKEGNMFKRSAKIMSTGVVLTGHVGPVTSVSIRADARVLASGSRDSSVKIWLANHDMASNSTSDNSSNVSGSCKASSSNKRNKACLGTLSGHTDTVTCVKFSQSSPHLVTSASDDGWAKMWDTRRGTCVLSFQSFASTRSGRSHDSSCGGGVSSHGNGSEDSAAIKSVDIYDDIVACGSTNGVVKLWDTRIGGKAMCLQNEHVGAVTSISFSPDGECVATGGDDGALFMWDIRHLGECVSTLCAPGTRNNKKGALNSLSYGPLWSFGGRSSAATGLIASGASSASSPLRSTLLSRPFGFYYGYGGTGSASGSLTSPALTPGSIELWDTSREVSLSTLKGHAGNVNSVSFTADGNHLLSGSADCTMRLWDVDSGETEAIISGHTASVSSIATCNSGCGTVGPTMIVSASEDCTLRTYTVWPYY